MTYKQDLDIYLFILIFREDSKARIEFFQFFVEDRTESSMSYYEFLQHLQKQVKS